MEKGKLESDKIHNPSLPSSQQECTTAMTTANTTIKKSYFQITSVHEDTLPPIPITSQEIENFETHSTKVVLENISIAKSESNNMINTNTKTNSIPDVPIKLPPITTIVSSHSNGTQNLSGVKNPARFKIVKIPTEIPYNKGRWVCKDASFLNYANAIIGNHTLVKQSLTTVSISLPDFQLTNTLTNSVTKITALSTVNSTKNNLLSKVVIPTITDLNLETLTKSVSRLAISPKVDSNLNVQNFEIPNFDTSASLPSYTICGSQQRDNLYASFPNQIMSSCLPGPVFSLTLPNTYESTNYQQIQQSKYIPPPSSHSYNDLLEKSSQFSNYNFNNIERTKFLDTTLSLNPPFVNTLCSINNLLTNPCTSLNQNPNLLPPNDNGNLSVLGEHLNFSTNDETRIPPVQNLFEQLLTISCSSCNIINNTLSYGLTMPLTHTKMVQEPPFITQNCSYLNGGLKNCIGTTNLPTSNTYLTQPYTTSILADYDNMKNYEESANSIINTQIDNKINMAMDLVKNHLRLAVKSEIDCLRDCVKSLAEQNEHLRLENYLLRTHLVSTSTTTATMNPINMPNSNILSTENSLNSNDKAPKLLLNIVSSFANPNITPPLFQSVCQNNVDLTANAITGVLVPNFEMQNKIIDLQLPPKNLSNQINNLKNNDKDGDNITIVKEQSNTINSSNFNSGADNSIMPHKPYINGSILHGHEKN